jgi:ribosome recycling factor
MATTKEEIAQIRRRMEKAVEDLRKELATIRTGRASISILDSITVDYYGTPTPINQAAQLGTPDATLITVQPYDVSLVGPIEKAIRASDLGLNPSNDGRLIRIPIPPLTEERRKTLAKHVHSVLEDHRTAVRNIRRDGNDHMKKMLKDKTISEDEEKKSLDEIQKLTDDFIKKLEEVARTKEAEIMKV